MFTTEFLDLPALDSANGSVSLPGSKSISNRVLLLAALSQGTTTIHDLLDSDDTRVMLAGLKQLGCSITPDAVTPGQAIDVTGIGGQLPAGTAATLFLGNAGTAMRPLTAALSVLGGNFEMTGVPRMYERPIGDLVDALRQLGCKIDYLKDEGFPPLKIGQPDFSQLGSESIKVRGDVSSQFLTSLLMALPLLANVPGAQRDITIEVVGELISRPYIHITLELLARFGIAVKNDSWQRFVIPAGSRYQSPGAIHVEADASSASYFIALGAIATGTTDDADADNAPQHKSIRILGVGQDSIQGDIRFIEAAQAMGAQIESGPNWLQVSRGSWPLKAIDLDCNHIPDAAMTLGTMALYADGVTTLRNIASWRVKETDRIAAMAIELRKLGASVEEGADYIRITPPAGKAAWKAASIHTYDDHRVAMCFSLAAFNPAKLPVRIEDPKCVAKTFPDYFEALFSVSEAEREHIPVICIDGPTASGKGTIAAEVARALGYQLLDSGALYRITGLAASRAGMTLDESNEETIAEMALDMPVRFDAQQRVWLGDEDISLAIRSEEAGMNASRVSALPAVRTALVDLQLSFQALPGLVADGRDMGTVIFPHAPLKVYLWASAQCRAERRYKQLISKGISANMSTLLADLEARDARDMNRSTAPLKPAEDSLQLDSSEMTIEEVVAQVLSWWQERQPFGRP
ncbi:MULTISPECIES: bifunctional 3-phosphoshikimate 1-carboxyvinyltransferase/cytidylate kinase [Comamonas]|uniref:bifunctional 3-phosphoshikimate 1-carboxyvinyltransferase/cytidylate kinase n=1 Tax=Comamonas TaxID=283 RepID=UPI0005105EC5|nr:MULTISPECIES: bifunctional 3-phosphoshikimate 1-carboxyvinyltransferase/cytidylate kinase [Comamonas]KGG89941.1 3-phosphoshikimate 1-carboxyvinyltransferase [Comamonas thiooxydans]KGG97444.1 3-phosphoshikimate 1-carboxyvinyltransferase [Comamonas thiooxydans]KGH01267.1 3-phosphoshikimate 1-carboxyvinyltransferase [Comamonas thiooxydans]KGH10342.1 3-phosphoshikimate 1-carboxyvinyltransferase [Comamonas thiooxydans]TZG06689.1 bifunctional 3-phosphoshikimate 1-carboxyvinyltransferase/cytidylat